MKAASRRSRWRRVALAASVLFGLGAGFGFAWMKLFPDRLARSAAAYERGDLPLALIEAKEALKASPKNPDALRIIARSSARLGQHQFARDVYDQLGVKALRAEDYFVIAAGLLREGKRSVARTTLELALKDDPNHPEALYEMARMLADSNTIAAAIPLAKRLSQTRGWEVRGSAMLGLLQTYEAEPLKASENLARALRLDPKLAGVSSPPAAIRKILARELLKAGQPTEARAQLKMVLASGSDAEASWLMSRASIQLNDRQGASDALADARAFGAGEPTAFEPAPFVGSLRCAECHRDIHRFAQSGRHAKTFRPASEVGEFRIPDQPVPDPDNPKVVHTLTAEGSGVAVKTQKGDEIARALVEFAVGSGDRGLTPVGRDDTGRTRELRLSYYGDISGWDRTSGHPSRPGAGSAHDFLGEVLTPDAVRICLDCHTTNFRAARDHVGPEAADRGIGCERCHGPAGNHLAAVALKLSDLAIGRPRAATPEQVVNLCAQCHFPRGRTFSPSDPISVRFQGLTFPRSRCYTETGKGFDCVSCHSPHRDAETSSAFYESKCLACHSASEPDAPAQQTAKSGHVASLPAGARRVPCPVNPVQNCIECHMPTAKTVVPHTYFTDHHIRVHRDAKTKLGE
jgi:Tfp pilus assembly protein PilF